MNSKFKEAWNDKQKRHNITFVIFILLILLIIGAYFGISALLKGENLIKGSWQYTEDIASYGDIPYTMHFASDGRFYMNSEFASNSGTYTIIRGGEHGKFSFNLDGVVQTYEYTLNEDHTIMYLKISDTHQQIMKKVED